MTNRQKSVDYSKIMAPRLRFLALWTRCGLSATELNAVPVFDELVRYYREPARFYHNWPHVSHCLLEFDQAVTEVQSPNAVELALWFHDAIFVAGAADNEQRSADLLVTRAGTSMPAAFVKQTCDLILVTTHKQAPRQGDESYMADIDLSAFGVDWPAFVRDTLSVRKEQPNVPDDVYHAGHARFLRMLLDRQRIFHTDLFHERYEISARRNIQRLLATDRYRKDLSGF